MYYEEQIIEGVLHWRSDPNGKWTPYTIAELSHRYDALAQRLAVMEKERDEAQQRYEKQCEGTKSRIEKIQFLQTEHARLRGEREKAEQRVERLEEALVKSELTMRKWRNLCGIDVDEAIETAQQAMAQGVWSTEKPTEAGWYWWRATPAREHWEICRVTGEANLTAHFADRKVVEPVRLVIGEWCRIQEPREAGAVETVTCRWTEDEEGNWSTACGGLRVLDGAPSEHRMRFCSECGKPLAERRYQQQDGKEGRRNAPR